MPWPVAAADLTPPYDTDPGADAACDAARSEIRRAIRSSPAGYLATDAAILADAETAAEMLGWGIALAHDALTRGRGGAGHKIVLDAQRARRALKSIAEGATPLPLEREPSSTPASRRAITVAGSAESDIPAMLDAYDDRAGTL